ncbi:CppA N-terminal domain-containing protein [Streptococcus peroris]|uniref:CppA protein n=1 Tax=Streptococcus peroris ATCC 700780 TaxID=888746 RepID=E8KAR8_9STRE|nr:CppA N-terminal domain-containing protein [Streptococcus peroris]EFX40820.1 CppA protein [Streptococcus peroris ATCC 700780]MDU7074507.1 CppA N-terminal domain-containing protein [Streptococcus peroris]
MSVNQIVRMIPTLKVNNRNLNELFYVENLGMKPLLEESAFLSLGDQSGIEKLVLEESPSMRSRKVEGVKKLARLIVKVENPSEIEALLARMDKIPPLYKGNKGYAFEALSPEGDCVLIHAEDDIKNLKKVEDEITFSKDESMKYLTAFEISVEVNLPDETRSLLEKEDIEGRLAFNQAQGSDLLVENNVTWDLSMLKFQVKEFNLAILRQRFETADCFVPKSEKFFLTKDSNNIELWFEQV